MLTENDVVELVCVELIRNGYSIEQQLSTNQTGIDIIATSPDGVLCGVEAKGATSSKNYSSRFGQEFNSSQVKTHIGMAIVASFKLKNKYPDCESIIAIPDNEAHHNLIKDMYTPLLASGIKVWLVSNESIVKFI